VANFEFIPAIDVLGGRCVQLAQGKYDRATVFDDDPVAVAARFAAHPIRRLHVARIYGRKIRLTHALSRYLTATILPETMNCRDAS